VADGGTAPRGLWQELRTGVTVGPYSWYGRLRGLAERGVVVLRAWVASYGYVPSSPIVVTLMTDALRSPKTPVLTAATRRNVPEDGIFRSPRLENLIS
jgi:hypothetical protein